MNFFKISIKGFSWLGGVLVSMRALSFVKFLIIVKIISVTELGYYSIIVIIVSFFDILSDLGVNSFLMHPKHHETKYLNTAWVVSIIRGSLFSLIILVCAYPLSLFFNAKEIFPFIMLSSIIPFIKGFENPAIVGFVKNFKFEKEFAFRVLIVLSEVILSILLILVFKNVIVLIYSLILAALIEVVLSYLLIKIRPVLEFDRNQFGEILNFGKWYSLSSIAVFLSQQLDSIIVGRNIGVSDLGLYQIAQKFSLQIITSGGDVVAKVMLPIYAKLGTSKKRLSAVFSRTILVIGGLAVVAGILMIIFSESILIHLIDLNLVTKINTPFRIFTILGATTVVMSLITSLLLSKGKSDYIAKLVVLRLIFIAILLGPLSKMFGLTGASTASLLSFIFTFPLALYYSVKVLSK